MANNRIRFSNDFILKDEKVGINTTEPRAQLDVGGDLYVSGISTISQTSTENLSLSNSGIAVTAILDEDDLISNRDDALATQQSIKSYVDNRVGDVDLNFSADSGIGTVNLNTEIFSITGTSNEIETVGFGNTITIGLPNNVTISNDLTIIRNLDVYGNIAVGGTTAIINADQLQVKDKDIVLGITTDAFGNDISTDFTANGGGIAIASTEGSPLVCLKCAGINTFDGTYKQLIWFKEGSFTGLGTDAWLSNYAIGIGSTQVPNGVRLAAGGVQFTDNDIIQISNINASGIITAAQFIGTASFATTAFYLDGFDPNTTEVGFARTTVDVIGGIGSITSLNVSGISTLGFLTATDINVSGSVTATNFYGNLVGIASTSINVIGGIASVTSLDVSGTSTLSGVQISSGIITSTNPGVTTVVYYGDGSNLEGVTAFYVDNQVNTTDLVYPTLAAGVGVNSVGISTNKLVFIETTTRLGIGTTNPTTTVDITGDVKVSGLTTTQNLYVSGISTFISEANFDNNVNIDGTVGIGTVVDIIAYDTLSNGTLSFEGSAGQLFSITNNLTSGSIFSVNDVSGIPSIDVDADGTIQLAPYGSAEYIGIGKTNPTEKVDVVGNVKVSGLTTTQNLYVTGVSTFTNAYISGNTGIGTKNPTSKLDVIGDVRVGINTSQGLILTSPNGTTFRLVVDNSGTLSAISTTL